MASQIHKSSAEALNSKTSSTKVRRNEGGKKHYLEAAPRPTMEMSKRMRINESGGSLIWRFSRDAGNGARKFSFRQSAAAVTTASTATLDSKLPPVSKSSAIIIEDGKNGVNSRKQPRCRLPVPKLLDMGVNCGDDGLVCPLRKRITRSDIDRYQNRLLLPKDTLNRPLFERLMTPTQRAQAMQRNGLAVKVLDRVLAREYELVLKFLPSIQSYRIMGRNYSKLVVESKFCVGRLLDLWLFRVPTATTHSELKMAVVVQDDGDDEKAEAEAEAEEIQLRALQDGEGEETKSPLPQPELGHGCSEAETEAMHGLLSLQYAPPPPLIKKN